MQGTQWKYRSTVDIALLNVRITVQKNTVTVDSIGNHLNIWTDWYSYAAGTKVTLSNVAMYTSSTAKEKASTKTGTYYLWSSEVVNGRIRITNSTANVGKSGQVTGWVNVSDLGLSTTTSTTSTDTEQMYRVRKIISASFSIIQLKFGTSQDGI